MADEVEKRYDFKLKEYEQNMITYRYLADMNVKYVMFFIIISGVILKVYFDAQQAIQVFLLFLIIIGIYVSWSVYLVFKRMESLSDSIHLLETELDMQGQDFKPFLKFLKLTVAIVMISTVLIAFGIYNYNIESDDNKKIAYDKSNPSITFDKNKSEIIKTTPTQL